MGCNFVFPFFRARPGPSYVLVFFERLLFPQLLFFFHQCLCDSVLFFCSRVGRLFLCFRDCPTCSFVFCLYRPARPCKKVFVVASVLVSRCTFSPSYGPLKFGLRAVGKKEASPPLCPQPVVYVLVNGSLPFALFCAIGDKKPQSQFFSSWGHPPQLFLQFFQDADAPQFAFPTCKYSPPFPKTSFPFPDLYPLFLKQTL